MLITKYVRIRKLFEYLTFLLQKLTRNVNIQEITITFVRLILLVNTSACCWRVLSLFQLNSSEGWLMADGSYDKPKGE